MRVFKIDDIPEFSKKERIVVVGVIGKSPYRYPNKAAALVSSVQVDEKGIECHWDERRGILYLHAVTDMDAKQLLTVAKNLDENSKSTLKDADAAHWLVAAGELAMEACKTMALLFNLCHIIVLSSPTPVFDIGYIQLFKAIDAYRLELSAQVTSAVSTPGAWQTNGRWCCPRLLFHFQRAPTPLRRNVAGLKKLEHAVEDQLYFILRKARIITNICAKSLFAIPKNEEFVYINASPCSSARDVSSLVRGLVQLCAGTHDDVTVDRPTFAQFVYGHVDIAFKEGFDDNVVKYAMNSAFFELPSASTWRTAAQAILPIYLDSQPLEEDQPPGGALYDALSTDVRFSEARCAKVLPIAQASYAEGLPSHYSSQHHAHKVVVGMAVLAGMGRGPLAGAAAARLRASTAAAWRARTLCEAPSLTGHPCHHPDHDNTKEHSSGVRYISVCNCGRTKCSRADPYTIKQANYTFYQQAAEECGVCNTLQTISFPVFQPSTPTFREASVVGATSEEECVRASSASGELSEQWSDLSPGLDQPRQDSPDHHHTYQILPPHTTHEDKSISRQASTTEYLPGMLHAGSPPGLVPAYPAWWLGCIGPSSLYSHNLGLLDSLQPGFLPHTNYLLPWDCSVKLEGVWGWRGAGGGGRGGRKPHHHLTVKIFLGYEYECSRGHRFIYQSGGGGAAAMGAGARVAGGVVPLHASCPCRAPRPAHLARLHVVTPKANVHVTLDPKVQPVPNGPIFVPQPAGSPPIKLSGSTYWVLRFPYMYRCERGLAPIPDSCPPHPAGEVLPPMFGLVE